MHQRLVPATLIPGILDLAIKNRINVEKIFATAKVDLAVIGHTGTFLTLEQILRLFNAAYSAMNDPAFGIRLGESVQYHSLDLVGQLVATSRNLEEALDELFQFKDLVAPFTLFSLDLKGKNAILGFSIVFHISTKRFNFASRSFPTTPVFIKCAPNPTAKSEIQLSVVSTERCEAIM